MMNYRLLIVFIILFASCRKNYQVTVPDQQWDLFESANTKPLTDTVRNNLQGVFSIDKGNNDFGGLTALKWTYNAHGTDTTYYLSMFCETDVAYFILEGKRLDSSILLNGYWRKMTGTATGKARFTISAANGARQLLNNTAFGTGGVMIDGVYGFGDDVPAIPIQLNYLRPLYHATPLEIVVHRGGGQTADLLPASENSAQIIQWASRFGATGIEVDVRLTKDGVPILYHDDNLSERLIIKNGLVGPIENYTYAQLDALVRLIRNGEHIPTLREALQTVVYNTPLRYVWLDTKFHGDMKIIRDIQQEYLQKAAAIGRNLEITIGIPDETVLNNFMALPNYQNIPSVCELDPSFVEKANSRIWGPRWTLGIQTDKIAAIHAQGRRAFIWTLDVPENVKRYLYEGNYDGILTDYPSIVAYYHYVRP